MKREWLLRITAGFVLVLAVGVYVGACASSSGGPSGDVTMAAPPSSMIFVPAVRTSGDPRIGLKPGTWDTLNRRVLEPADEAIWNLRLLSNTPPAPAFAGVTNSDLAFTGPYAIQGNYNGYMVWDISNPRRPTLKTSYLCPASQSDVSVYGNVLFVSAEAPSARVDCGTQGVPEPVSQHRIRGIRVFDATDITQPKYLANVQTCRGSHTHTVVSDPRDRSNVYVYVSGSAGIRSAEELPGCLDAGPSIADDPNTARFRIEVIKVPLAAPQTAAIVSSPRIFQGLTAPPRSEARDSLDRAARAGRGGGRGGAAPAPDPAGPRPGPSQCHDITVYPAVGLAGGACGGYGLLLDIRDVANPQRIFAAADSNMSFWHSATFSNDASKILFTDEWGGGGSPKCRATDKYEWGANALFRIENNRLVFQSYYKMPAAQTELENCVAHNGSLIPIPGREVMVQGWYQGGISIFDWTEPTRPYEIAYHDRGPVDETRMRSAGSWSVYWYNGVLVSSEIARGLDVYELLPSGHLTQNEIDAARTVRLDQLNAQEQPMFVWPPSFPLARAYVDQLVRSRGLSDSRIAAIRSALSSAERASGQRRRDALTQLASQLQNDAQGSSDAAKVRTLATAVTDLANAQR